MELTPLVCDCCRRTDRDALGVASSSLGAISFAYCQECVDNDSEPEMMFEYMYSCVANDLNHLVPEFRLMTTWKDGRYWTAEEWYPWRTEHASEFEELNVDRESDGPIHN